MDSKSLFQHKRIKEDGHWKIRIRTLIISILVSFCLIFQQVQPIQAAQAKTLNPGLDEVISKVRSYMLKVDTNPDFSSAWNALGIARSGLGLPAYYKDTYYNNTIYRLKSSNWDYKTNRYSDYSKLILAMTSIGVDASNVDGHNLLFYLSDFKKIKKQGFNGPIWALIALNAHPSYEIPDNPDASEQTTEEGLIRYLLNNGDTSAGGWTLYGDRPDADITSMTLQALAPYYHEREDVRARVDRALSWLASAQLASGGYATLNGSSTVETSESAAQVVVALSALGINPADSGQGRFVTSAGKWPMSRLFEYVKSADGNYGFMHVESGGGNNGGGAAGTIDGMATEQGMYAAVAYKRMIMGKTALFDMSDLTLSPGKAPEAPAATTEKAKSTTSSAKAKVKVTKITLNKQKLFLQKGKSATVKATVTTSTAANKKLKWTSANSKIATVTQKGKVKGIKAGTTVITAKARDGSGVKASCKVIVSTPASSTSSSNKKSSGSGSGTSSTSSTSGTSSTESYNATTWSSTTAAEEETTEEEEESTQAGAWSFGGADYKPEGDNEIPQAEGNLWDSEDFEDYEESTELEDPYALSNGEKETGTHGASNLPNWLSVLLGLAVPAALAGLVAAPWDKIRGKRKK